jgi:predicted ATPase/DNA-binding SARP family transcriptional activator
VVSVPEAKVRALLAELLVYDGRPVSTDELIEDLWKGHPPGKPVGTLQAKVSRLRRVLEDAEPGGRQLVVSVPSGYQLDTTTAVVDADQFAALAERARATDDLRDRLALLAEALALWRGPAFADLSGEPFGRPAVTRLEEERLVVLEERIEARLGLGEHHQVAGELGELVAQHPLRERLRAAHMRALYRAGRQSEALASYGELRDQLVEELGVDPSPQLAELHLAILRHDPQLAPPRTGPVHGNLPVALTDLIGRATAIAEVTKLLTAHRLVTLTGPGGVGKTRLAVEAAARIGATCPDGAWLVELGPVAPHRAAPDVGSLVTTVNATLEIRDAPAPGARPATAVDRLAGALQAKRSLLVLDNCEHVVEAAAELAQRLLAAAPDLRILATSREPLGLAGEALWIVPPLEAPDPDLDAEAGSLHAFSAVQLFVARAAAAAPGFAVGPTNAAAVAAICRRLDGIPLALELAATRVRGLGVHELATRVDDRFRLLVAAQHGAPPRQQTLRAVIDWSWDLLGPAEQAVLRRLAVPADGCALAGAEQICSGDGVEATDVAPVLARLVDRSMVVMTDTSGAPRYRLLESVAAYGWHRLVAAGEADEVRRRHRRYHTELTEQAASHLRGPDQQDWLELLDPEGANLRRSLVSAVEDGDSGLALRLVNAAAWYWFLRGRLVDGRQALETALAAARDRGAPARARAHAWLTGFTLLAGHVVGSGGRAREAAALCDAIDQPSERPRTQWFLGFAASDWGDPSTSEELVARALIGSRSVGDDWVVAAALSTRAKLAYLRGDLTAVRDNGEQSLMLFRDIGDRWGQLQATEWLGAQAMAIGDYDRATQLYQDGRHMAEALALWPQAADQMSWLGRVEALVGDPARARGLHARAMQLATDHGYQPGADFAELGLADTARRQGELATAEHYLTRVLDRIHANGLDPGMTDALVFSQLGFVAEQRGDAETARIHHLDSLRIARKLGDPRAIARALEGLAGAHSLTGNHERAAELLGAAGAARSAAGAPLPPALRTDVDRITRRARAALGPAHFTAALNGGTNLDPRDPATT